MIFRRQIWNLVMQRNIEQPASVAQHYIRQQKTSQKSRYHAMNRPQHRNKLYDRGKIRIPYQLTPVAGAT